MKQTIWTNGSLSTPDAFITKGKQRVKQYGNIVYLNDRDEFEIELFNPTKNHILAKILLDCKSISNSGIVLKPGQRIFLERYLDTNNRFVFSTYEVDGSDRQVVNAISDNGSVQIEFFKEAMNKFNLSSTLYNSGWNPTSTITIQPNNFNTPTFTTCTSTSTATFTASTSTQGAVSTYANAFVPSTPKSIETGIVERGRSSSQSFQSSDRVFETSAAYHTISWKILPVSRKQYTTDNLPVVYCTNCGAKRKKDSHKFCPHCGNKFH